LGIIEKERIKSKIPARFLILKLRIRKNYGLV
jgi:hypothetical protein